MGKDRILIVDDERLIASSLASLLGREGFEVESALTGAEALVKLERFRPQLVMLDISLPDMDGLELLRRVKGINGETRVIMMTAHASADCALQALKDGAEDFFGKPFDLELVRQVVRRTLEKREAGEEKSAPELRRSVGHGKMIGNSPKMIGVFKLIKAAADADAKTVLITGESGTGKELVARAIHSHSGRAGAPFVEVNCASIPENLLENELFGHERGAFTDASRLHKGLFEAAHGGTLFLDEIGDMPLPMQAKVLKAIENRRFRRLGGREDVEADVRIVAATHQDLPKMVAQGKFRGDLFFRLNVMHIELPPLRERAEDIEPLVQYMIESLNAEYGRKVAALSPATLACLAGYHWPGNVRELRNAIERLMMLEPGNVLPPDQLPAEIRGVKGSRPMERKGVSGERPAGETIELPPSGIALDELEKLMIQRALAMSEGNQTRAARLLKTSRDTLRYRMKKHGLGEGSGNHPASGS
ncbi:sigma-54-dependent Fis family transcriptional regulator [Geomonas sp. Red276]